MKKILAMLVAATMILGMVNIFAVAETTATGSVYYLNFKPEQAERGKLWPRCTPSRPVCP